MRVDKKKFKVDNYTDNLKKTNKTLMALLNGILQRRIRILKEATKCLCRYKPLLSKINCEKINRIVSDKKKHGQVSEEKINQKASLGKEMWCTGKDCLKLLNNETKHNGKIYFFKWFLYLCNDYNLSKIK